MSFVSLKFVLFLGFSFFIYFVMPSGFQWVILLCLSYLYYYLSCHNLVAVLFAVSVFTYAMGRIIDKQKNRKIRTVLYRLGIAAILLNLIVIKYSDFIIGNINSLFSGNFDLFNFVLPLGISYYTLQAISYLIDVGKKKTEAEKNVFHFLLYMSYFPQIVQGPIPKYDRLKQQLIARHDFDYERITHGLQLMLWGIAKKIILADRLGVAVKAMFDNYADYHGLFLFFAVVCYGFQIYADFSGGIDTIRGISNVFGIELDINFRQPYFAKSIEEFWRRWHISLGAWMKEYIFYPLSLSRSLNSIGKRLRSVVGNDIGKKFAPFTAMFVVYLLVGIWHGADWKYVAYGIWNGIFTMTGVLFEDFYRRSTKRFGINTDSLLWKLFQMCRTFLIVSVGRLIVRSSSLQDAFRMFKLIFNRTADLSLFNAETLSSLGINIREWILCLIAVIIILFIDLLKEKQIDVLDKVSRMNIVLRWTVYLLLIMSILIFGKYGPGYEAANFIYGNF